MPKILVLFLVSICLIAISCSDKLQEISNFTKTEEMAHITIHNLETKYLSAHKIKTRVNAPIAYKFEYIDIPYLEFPQGVEVIFYNDSLQEESKLTANYAIYYEKKKLWEARSNVRVSNVKGDLLMTEQLFGDENAEKIFSVKKVTIIEADSSVIVGKGGFESNTTFTIYRFLDVNGLVQLNEEYGNDININGNQQEK